MILSSKTQNQQGSEALSIARDYQARGWAVLPVPFREKGPLIDEWQHLRLTAEQLPKFFNGRPQNVGVLLGEPSGGLIDVDLDHEAARELAAHFLPATASKFGRTGKPLSHLLYIVDESPGIKQFKAKDVGMLLEFRANGGQTVFPGSTHPSGEIIEWAEDGEPARVSAADLMEACVRLAAACKAKLGIVETPPTRANLAGVLPQASLPRLPANVLDRARKYIAKKPPAIMGQNGSDPTFAAACALVLGFNLSPDDAYPLLAEWNETHAKPVWTERELRHKLDDAHKQLDARGYLLNAQRPNGFGPPPDESEHLGDDYDCGETPSSAPSESRIERQRIAPIPLGQLMLDHQHLQEPIIDGLLRRGETANIIAAPKVGKSWLAYGLAWSVVTGGDWLGKFRCTSGRVLLVDNELHPPTLAHRVPNVARAMGINPVGHGDAIDVLSLRGRLLDLNAIAWTIEKLEAGTYQLVILDAFYRTLPLGISENDNAAVMALYNTIDAATARLDAAWLNIHHASKGSQIDKAVTDMGAGAGSQSRAADAHIVLRPHEEPGIIVLEAVVRSFAPVAPLALRWEFPLWMPADDVDVGMLKGRSSPKDERKAKEDKAGIDGIIRALMKATEPMPLKKLMAASKMGKARFDRLAYQLEDEKQITSAPAVVSGNRTTVYSIVKEEGCSGVLEHPRNTETPGGEPRPM